MIQTFAVASTASFGTTREFPARTPAGVSAEQISLETLVHHRFSTDAAMPLERVQRIFQQRQIEFMAVERAGRVIGACSRGQLGFIMSSRFGFALYSQHPIETMLVANPLIVPTDAPVRDLLDRALARQGDEFHEDIVLVDADGALVGLIKVETLAQLQSRLVQEQLAALKKQHDTLQQQNLELFRTAHAARQSKGLYLSLFRNHALGVALLDASGVIAEHNARLGELLNCGDTALTIASLTAWVADRERPAFLAMLEMQGSGVDTAAHEFTLHVPERGPRLFRFSCGWITETSQICACLEDVTEQRALERNALRQEKQVLLDTLVGGIAHELNNKLTPVQGFSELISLEAGPTMQCYADLITKSVGEAARIIRQLLDLSRPTTQLSELLDLRSVVEEALVMLKFQIRESACQVRTDFSGQPVFVAADAGQLKQVVLNLMINALHAMEQCPVRELTLAVHPGAGRAEIHVKDSGCGIRPEDLGRIFDPFFTTKGPERGTGLGLSICYSLVRQHCGEIAVTSEVGQGSTFTVSLPLKGMDAPPLFTLPDAVVPASMLCLPGRRVLVVEDEVVLQRLMQEILRTRFGCEVDVASNGTDALHRIQEQTYCLILSDIRMPEMDGPGLYLRLREAAPDQAQRMVFITGHPGDAALEAEIAQWNVPVVAKPFSLTRLTEICRPFLERPATRAASA